MITTLEICIPNDPTQGLEDLESCYIYPHDNWMDVDTASSDGDGFFAVTVQHPAYDTERLEAALSHLKQAIEITAVQADTPYIACSDVNDDPGDEYNAIVTSLTN